MGLMNRLGYYKKDEVIFGEPVDVQPIKKAKLAVINMTDADFGNRISKTFASMVNIYNTDPLIHESIDQAAQQIISTGIFQDFNELYTVSLPRPDGKGYWTAEEVIKHFNKVNDLDSIVLQIAIELQAFGNSFWQITDNGLTYVPIEAIDKAVQVDKSTPIREKYHLICNSNYYNKQLNWGEFIHFRTSTIGNGAFGTGGVIVALITRPAEDVPSLYEFRVSMRKSMAIGFKRFGMGNLFVGLENVDDETYSKIETTIKQLGQYGNIILSNTPVQATTGAPERATGYDKFIETENYEFMMALANPSLKLGLESGFTKATAQAAVQLYEAKIESFRRIIKRGIEPIWADVLNKLGFDGEAANVTLRFGMQQKPEYVVTDLFKAVELGIMSHEACAKILRKSLGWEIPPNDKPQVPKSEGNKDKVEVIVKSQELDEVINKVEGLNSKICDVTVDLQNKFVANDLMLSNKICEVNNAIGKLGKEIVESKVETKETDVLLNKQLETEMLKQDVIKKLSKRIDGVKK